MKTHTRIAFILYSLLLSSATANSSYTIVPEKDNNLSFTTGKPIQILLVTGGNKRSPESFLDIFFSMKNIRVDTLSQPRANEALLSDSIHKYDALVFYDMTQPISDLQKEKFIGLTKKGTGLVFLHHSLVSYQKWEEFKNIVGGKYYENKHDYPAEKQSNYKHDLTLHVKVINPKHPVNNGINDFTILEEGYSNIEVLPGITPLLSTSHPDCTDIIAWANQYNNSRVVYLLPGHDDHAYTNVNYRKLISNAIQWTTKKR